MPETVSPRGGEGNGGRAMPHEWLRALPSMRVIVDVIAKRR